jgi:predicted enzyme related to lactoylglutathione lyase
VRKISGSSPLIGYTINRKDIKMKFCGICLITESVPTLVGFYEKVFSSKAEGDNDHADFYFGGVNLSIFSKEGMEQLAKGSMHNAGYGSFTMGFEVDDVDAEFERLEKLDIEFVKLPTTHPWGYRSLWFRDPDGNIINFLCQVTK